jgi:hypothetical protein
MKLYCRDEEIDDFEAPDDFFDRAEIHICSGVPGDWRCKIRVVVDGNAGLVKLYEGECDNELCLEDCNLVRDDE